jgi:hypothetical protein
MTKFFKIMLAAAALTATPAALAAPNAPNTLTQTFTRSATISLVGGSAGLVAPLSFYSDTFLPFVGDQLIDGLYSINLSVRLYGTTPADCSGCGFAGSASGTYYLNQTPFGGNGSGNGTGGPANSPLEASFGFTESSVAILSRVSSLARVMTGSSPFTIGFYTVTSGPVVPVHTEASNAFAYNVDVTYQSSLVYQYNGAGALGGAGAVPEPASWAMLITGFGLTGAAARRRRTTAAIA